MPRGKKSTPATETVSAVEAESAPVNEVVVESATVEQQDQSLSDCFTELLNEVNAMRTQITSLTNHIRALKTRSEREIKSAQKAGRKRKQSNRKPSGFTKPSLISNELASFLNVPTGTEMARTEVTKEINKYIITHKLQDPANGRRILADVKLRKLLKLGKSDELTYFNLQKFMSPHFTKTVAPTSA